MTSTSTAAASSRTQVLLGEVVLPDSVVPDGAVVLEGDRIRYAGPRAGSPVPSTEPTVPLPPGARLLPGLVDIHCHGAAGGEFGSDERAVRRAAGHHHRAGTTSVVASLVSAPADTLVEGMRTCAALAAEGVLAAVHAEGPFLAESRRGAQDPAALTPVDLDLVDRLVATGQGHWAVMTYAPELDEGFALVKRLAEAGVVPAVGHTDADQALTAAALRAAEHALDDRPALVTHLFNAMPPLHHRGPGPAGAALRAAAKGEAVVELIADGVHLADAVVALVFGAACPDAVALVSDAMSACGMPDGAYALGRLDVVVDDGVARLADGGGIAGGTSTLLEIVRRCVQEAEVPIEVAVRAASATPARVLGLGGSVGALTAGLRADVVAVDAELLPLHVWRSGALLREDRT